MAMMKSLKSFYEVISTFVPNFMNVEILLNIFWDRVELTPSTRALQASQPFKDWYSKAFFRFFLKSHVDILPTMFIKATCIVNSKISLTAFLSTAFMGIILLKSGKFLK